MKKLLANKLTRLLPIAALVASAFAAPLASAGAAIGFNERGNALSTGIYKYSDLWTNLTDSALSVGFNPFTTVDINNPAQYYNAELIAQTRVGALVDTVPNVINTPAGLNIANGNPFAGILDTLNIPRFELTKVLRINERVIQQVDFASGGGSAQFDANVAQPNIDPNRPNATDNQLEIWYDAIADGSEANPNTAKCYGPANPSFPGAINPCGHPDGILILAASLISGTSSFATGAPPLIGVGTGSFDLRFKINFVDRNYLDIATNSIFGDKLTGTVNVPSLYNPTKMWDGTNTSTGLLLKVDSSESFLMAVPEPGSLALVGLGLLGAGLIGRRRRD